MKEDEIYPLTVICDRYMGTYNKDVFKKRGNYIAWNLYPWQVPSGIYDEDDTDNGPDVPIWYDIKHSLVPVGLGRTIAEAVNDLDDELNKLNEKGLSSKWCEIVEHYDAPIVVDGKTKIVVDGKTKAPLIVDGKSFEVIDKPGEIWSVISKEWYEIYSSYGEGITDSKETKGEENGTD